MNSLRMMTKREKPDEGGFMLVELLVAGAILSIAAAVILGSMSASARAMKRAELRSRAVNLLQRKAGEVESDGLSHSDSGDFAGRAPGFSWSAEPDLNDCDADLCRVTVTVKWNERGAGGEVHLVTMASRNRSL